jgi:hypothetical protein
MLTIRFPRPLPRRAPRPYHPAALPALAAALAASLSLWGPSVEAVRAVCDEQPPLQNWTGGGAVVCPCFVTGEQAGSVFTVPGGHFPIQIIRVGIGWGSQNGNTGTQEEYAIHIYNAGLPNPGTPIFNLLGPNLTDGFINEFELEPEPGDIIVNSGLVTVTLEFLNDSTLQGPSTVHDGNGCQSGKNVIYADPGGWLNVCSLGLGGDWVFTLTYRSLCPVSVGQEFTIASEEAPPLVSLPNPFVDATRVEFRLANEAPVDLAVFDASGRRVAVLLSGPTAAGPHEVTWDGTDVFGRRVASGTYFLRLDAGGKTATRPGNLMR